MNAYTIHLQGFQISYDGHEMTCEEHIYGSVDILDRKNNYHISRDRMLLPGNIIGDHYSHIDRLTRWEHMNFESERH